MSKFISQLLRPRSRPASPLPSSPPSLRPGSHVCHTLVITLCPYVPSLTGSLAGFGLAWVKHPLFLSVCCYSMWPWRLASVSSEVWGRQNLNRCVQLKRPKQNKQKKLRRSPNSHHDDGWGWAFTFGYDNSCELAMPAFKSKGFTMKDTTQPFECRPVNQRVAVLILNQGTGLRCGPGPQ